MMATRRKHGKRSIVARLALVVAAVRRAEGRVIEREARMELAHAMLAARHLKRFVMSAERITARTL